MISIPPELAEFASAGLWHAAIVFIRVSAMVSVLPAFGERSVPMRVKIVLAAAFTAVTAPGVELIPVPQSVTTLMGYAITETIVGLALGISMRLFMMALQTAGSIAAQSTSLSQILGGNAAEPIPAMGYVLVIGGLTLAIMSGLHVHATRFMIYSYELFPAGTLPGAQALSHWGTAHLARAFSLAFLLAIPFVMASMIYNLTLGVISRAMPQLMVAFVGAPVITLGGLFILFLAAPFMLSVWRDTFLGFLADPMSLPK